MKEILNEMKTFGMIVFILALGVAAGALLFKEVLSKEIEFSQKFIDKNDYELLQEKKQKEARDLWLKISDNSFLTTDWGGLEPYILLMHYNGEIAKRQSIPVDKIFKWVERFAEQYNYPPYKADKRDMSIEYFVIDGDSIGLKDWQIDTVRTYMLELK